MALTLLDPTQTSKVWQYRRPVLQFGTVTTVAVESGLNGTSGDVTVLFSDGKVITVNSTTQTTFDITRNAALSGAKQSGLRTSLSEATNTWYALYAVRATDNDDTWVTVGDTVLPLQANYATLNSNFGTNKWCYLGLIRNGDNALVAGDILTFDMSGNLTNFRNISATGNSGHGTRLATGTAVSITWAYASGTGAAQVPANIHEVAIQSSNQGFTGTDQRIFLSNAAGASIWSSWTGVASASNNTLTYPVCILDGLNLGAGASSTWYLLLSAFVDHALGVGPNPLL